VQKRTTEKTGCPFCSGHRVSLANCLSTIFPDLANQWHPTKNGQLDPKRIIAGSDKKLWWICRENESHE
jgi:hypothetical protein